MKTQIPHPSLRRWKWVGEDVEGKPILMQGDMWIHPAAYGRLNALLGKSLIRTWTVPERVPVIGGTRPGARRICGYSQRVVVKGSGQRITVTLTVTFCMLHGRA
jgi:hypothetical protein